MPSVSTWVRSIFGRGARRSAAIRVSKNSCRLKVEGLEDRTVPAVAQTVPFSLQGNAGALSLSNDGLLSFAAGQNTTVLERRASAFNVDPQGNLYELNSNGDLWRLPAGGNPNASWQFLDNNVGSFGLSANGVMFEVRMNGNLWRFVNGGYDRRLEVGVTKADIDASGNVYALKNGDLIKFGPGPSPASVLNNGLVANGNSAGNVVSFSVGGNSVAWMLGLQDVLSARIEVSYANGANPGLVTDANNNGLTGVYAVAADGSLIVADPGAATNTGVTRLANGGFNVDSQGTDLPVNGAAKTGSSFSLPPNGRAIVVLDGTGKNLSAYSLAGGNLGAEQKLDSAGGTQSFGIGNDLKVYGYTTGNTLQVYQPFAANPVLQPAIISANVTQWQLGPNGEPVYVKVGNSLTVGAATIPQVAQVGYAPNGQLYYLTTVGDLYRGRNSSTTPANYNFSLIDNNTWAFSVNTNSTLIDIKNNGNVWRLAGSADAVYGAGPVNTVYDGWVQIFAGADVAAGSSQATGNARRTPLYTLPDGLFFFLSAGRFVTLSYVSAATQGTGNTDIQWESDPGTVAGVSRNVPAVNAIFGNGTFFSALETTGTNAIGLQLF